MDISTSEWETVAPATILKIARRTHLSCLERYCESMWIMRLHHRRIRTPTAGSDGPKSMQLACEIRFDSRSTRQPASYMSATSVRTSAKKSTSLPWVEIMAGASGRAHDAPAWDRHPARRRVTSFQLPNTTIRRMDA